MSRKINIILAKANWCYHCKEFTPIFELAREKIISLTDFSNCVVNVEIFDMADKDGKQKLLFEKTYPELVQYLKSYPSIYLQIVDTKNNIKKAEFVNHTVAKGEEVEHKQTAAEDFINNLVNMYKTMISENKELHISVKQGGGMLQHVTSLEEVKYRNKYLKYKTKYLEYKNNL